MHHHWLISWLILSVSVYIAAAVIPGIKLKGFAGAILVSALFGILQFFLGKLLFVTLGIATLGLGFLFAFLTRWVVSTLLLKLTDLMSDSLEIKGLAPAFWAAGLMSLLGSVGEYLYHHSAF